jgi:adenylate cyclase
LACAFVRLDDFDEALTLLESVFSRCKPGFISWAEADTDLDPIRKDERFQRIMRDTAKRLNP